MKGTVRSVVLLLPTAARAGLFSPAHTHAAAFNHGRNGLSGTIQAYDSPLNPAGGSWQLLWLLTLLTAAKHRKLEISVSQTC